MLTRYFYGEIGEKEAMEELRSLGKAGARVRRAGRHAPRGVST